MQRHLVVRTVTTRHRGRRGRRAQPHSPGACLRDASICTFGSADETGTSRFRRPDLSARAPALHAPAGLVERREQDNAVFVPHARDLSETSASPRVLHTSAILSEVTGGCRAWAIGIPAAAATKATPSRRCQRRSFRRCRRRGERCRLAEARAARSAEGADHLLRGLALESQTISMARRRLLQRPDERVRPLASASSSFPNRGRERGVGLRTCAVRGGCDRDCRCVHMAI